MWEDLIRGRIKAQQRVETVKETKEEEKIDIQYNKKYMLEKLGEKNKERKMDEHDCKGQIRQ